MALSKSVDTDYGVPASYANIQSWQVYFSEACLDVTMRLYVDDACRKAGKQPIASFQCRIPFASMGDTTEPTRAEVYAALKKLPAWADAKDA